MRLATDPVYAPNSYGGPVAEDPRRVAEAHWTSDGDMVRTAIRAATRGRPTGARLARWSVEVLTEEQRDRLVHNIIGHVSDGVKEPVLSRVFEYWRNVDPDLGKKVEEGVRANAGG